MKFINVSILLTVCISFSNGISFSSSYLSYFKRKAMEIIDLAGPKDDCSRHLKALVTDLFNIRKLWAMKMIDSTAKLQPGFMSGNIMHFGNYDECLSIHEHKGDDGIIEGQYCTVVLTPAKNTTSDIGQLLDFTTAITEIIGIQEGQDLKHILRFFKVVYGICIPKTCNAESLQKLWNHLEYTFRLPVHVSVAEDFCSSKGKVHHKFNSDIIVFWGFGLFFALICFASVYDVMFIRDNEGETIGDNILSSFSVTRNAAKILDIRPNPNEESIFSCFNGIKVISMLWVIYGHKYMIGFFSGTVNMMEYFETRKSVAALSLLVGPFAVDTFLVISGLLLAFKYIQVRDLLPSNKHFPYFMFYAMRLLRLWPCLIAAILFYTNILKYLNEGPLWPLLIQKTALSCGYGGIFTALFATNFVKFHRQCMEPTWYLSVDTQLYLIAPFILYFLYKYPKRTALLLVIVSLTSSVYAYFITVINQERWIPSEGDDSFHSLIYQSTFVRIPPWIFGILTGSLLYNFRHIRINKVAIGIMWFLAAVLFFGVFAANNIMMRQPYNEYYAGLFNAAARPSWGIAVAIVIFLCVTGYGGMVNDILSLNIYKPLTKISYSVYLIHMAMIMLFEGNKRSATTHSLFKSFHGYLGDMPFILIASFLWCLAFESPFINLGKLIIKRGHGYINRLAIAQDDKKRLKKGVTEYKESSKRKPKQK